MDSMLYSLYMMTETQISPLHLFSQGIFRSFSDNGRTFMAQSNLKIYHRKPPKKLNYPRRTKLPLDPGINMFLKKRGVDTDPSMDFNDVSGSTDGNIDEDSEEEYNKEALQDDENVWDSDEIEAISSLFQGRIPQKPGKLNRMRPLPLPLPYRLRPLGLPTPKRHVRAASPLAISSRASFFKQAYKNPDFLICLARKIRSLPMEKDVSVILNEWARFLQKGSLSLTIRELGHMGLPERALQTFCWAQKQPQLFPDDRILASAVEVLARTHDLKVPTNMEKFVSLASRSVIEATIRGFIGGGSLNLGLKLLMIARDGKRVLDPSIYAKLILELGKNPDKHALVLALLDDLGEREDLKLSLQDCTSVMKVCNRLGRYDIVESLFSWYRKKSGHDANVVMYTTLIHSRYSEQKYREALALVWEMEASNCLFDLPAYRVVIKLFVALNDLSRTVRYFSKLKEAGFSPTYDIYRDVIKIYAASRRLAKCKEVCKEVEMSGFKLDKRIGSQLLQLEREVKLGI